MFNVHILRIIVLPLLIFSGVTFSCEEGEIINTEINQIIQLAVTDFSQQQNPHIERKPLAIKLPNTLQKITLKGVEYLGAPVVKSTINTAKSAFIIDDYTVTSSSVSFHAFYEPEGFRMTFVFVKSDGKWSISEKETVELHIDR